MNIKDIVIHCAATENFVDYTAEDVHSWHQQKGWDGIGYHYVIRLDGTVENGRPEYWQGAHVGGYNENTLGIMLVGNDAFTDAQIDSLEQLVRELLSRYPDAAVSGHNEHDDGKTCPNFNASEWWQSVKKGVSNFQ